MASVKVARVDIVRKELTAAAVPELRELFNLERLPFAPSHVEIEIAGVPTAVVNALRRTVVDEMPGRALSVPDGGFDTVATTDNFMLPQFVNQRVALIPLRPQIPDDTVEQLRLGLDIANTSAAAMPFYAGDLRVEKGRLPGPLFNPTFRLGFLQPGKRIVVRDIRIASGLGRDDAAFNVARRGALRHLDLEQLGEKDTHERDGVAADLSGYRVSCLVANPRRHVLSAVLPATTADRAETVAVFVDACDCVVSRLRRVAAAVARGVTERAAGIQFTVVQLEAGLSEGTLLVPGETATIGVLLCRAVYELFPDISNVAHRLVEHENLLTVSARHTGLVADVFRDAVAWAIAVFEAIKKGIASS